MNRRMLLLTREDFDVVCLPRIPADGEGANGRECVQELIVVSAKAEFYKYLTVNVVFVDQNITCESAL